MSYKKSKISEVEKKTGEVKKEESQLPKVATSTPMPDVKKPKNVLKNISKQHHRIYGHIVKPGAIYEVSDADLKQETASKRIDNAIKQGYLERL